MEAIVHINAEIPHSALYRSVTKQKLDGAQIPGVALRSMRPVRRCRLLRSQSRVKRTCRFALHMSASDPKRTFHHPRSGLILRREKSFRLVEKFLPGWFTFQKHVIAAFKRDESRTRNAGCERAAFIKWYRRIITAMKD